MISRDYLAFAKTQRSKILFTLTQRKGFYVDASEAGLVFTPATGKPRSVSMAQLTVFCQAFEERKSYRRDAYPETLNGSYLVALAHEYLKGRRAE